MTRADRLAAILAHLAPERAAQNLNTGHWTPRPGDDRPSRFERRVAPDVWQMDKALTAADAESDPDNVRLLNRGQAPYEIREVAGRKRVLVFAEDGSVSVGNGATVEEALQDLERKLFSANGRPE